MGIPNRTFRANFLSLPLAALWILPQLSCKENYNLKRPQIIPKTSEASKDSAQAGTLEGKDSAPASTDKTSKPATDTPASSGSDGNEEPAKDPGNSPKKDEGKNQSESSDSPSKAPTGSDSSTRGKGGPTGDQELKSAKGLSFLMNAPQDVHSSGKAYGVLVLLHGSGASNYRNFVKQMATVAKQHDLIRVSVLAPNGKGWNEGGEVAAADALHALVQDEIFAKYNIDKRKVIFSGQSSGGGFLSTNFVPQHAKDYEGGAFMQCGAAPPRVTFKPDESTKAKFRLHFEITTGDTIWPASYKSALTKYQAAGMRFSKDDTKAGGHCAFDQQKVILDHIDFILGRT